MAAQKRIYRVSNGKETTLVRASNQAQAIHAVVKASYTASIPTQEELVSAIQGGAKVQDAGEVQ